MSQRFAIHPIQCGSLQLIEHPQWPCELWSWRAGPWQPGRQGTHYGTVYAGELRLSCNAGKFVLGAGMVFCVPGDIELAGDAQVFGITQLLNDSLFRIAGPVERQGRLRYIDGCTDSLLIPPLLKGEPCLNHLHFPAGIDQTAHTHPSLRAGLVLRGRGTCRLEGHSVPLTPGQVFHIPADEIHAFETGHSSMDVIAFHPDSDCGPEHDNHPMINRTYVDGRSARHIAHIRTGAVLPAPRSFAHAHEA
jgi:quercetin dioxygenase-like cupin family protein